MKVRFDESAARSHFVLNDNTITIAAGNKEHFQAQDLLHELIHATTRKALKDFSQSPEQAAKIYTKRQIEAIKEINSLYHKSKGIAKRQGKDAYALQNVDEFVAELSSSEFRAFLKAQDIFERFIKALIRFFTGDSERLAKNVNSYKALKESYYKILDDYEPPLVEKSVLDKNSEPQLAPNLSSDEILANSKAKSQGIFKDKTEQDYTNAYFQKLKKENPNLSDDKLLEEANDQAEFVRSSKNNIKLTTRIAKGYPKRDIRTEQELKDIYDEGSYFSLQQRREEIEDFYNITPLKEFGTNYAEFYRDGQGAVKKLLAEKQGQVAGAFYRQDLGDITLAWGKSYKDENGEWRGFGLAHILDKHGKEFKDLARELSEVVEKGVLVKESDDKIILKSPQHTIILGKKENDKFVVTGYRQNNAKKLETTQTGGAGSFADETHPRNSLSSNQQEILPQNELKSQGEKEFLSPNGEDIFAKTTPEQRNQIVKGIQGEIDELVKASYEIDGKIKQIAKVANERAEITGRYSRTSDEIKAIDALNKESEKLEKEVYKLQTLQNFFKGDLSNDFWEFLHNFNNEKALKWYEKEINKRVKSVSGDEIQKVSHEVSHINQNNAIMSEISHKGGQDGTSNASNGLNAAEKGMPTSEPAGISDGLFSQKQLLDEPRGAGADLSNSAADRQQPQTLFSQGASEPNASGGQQRGSNERLRTASGDLRGEVSGDGQNLRAEKRHNVSERFGQDRSEQHSRAKHTIRANSGSGASHSNATTTQELVSDTNAAGILSPAEKATIENQTFTQTIDPAKFNANEILSANINALKVLDELLITRNLATNEQKELLSAFSGAGGRFSDELNKIRKANPNDERLAYINGLLKQINEKLPKASGEIVDKGLSITDFYARSGDAYFTPTHIIKSMSDLAKKMGLKDESYILEPSAGVGRFLGFFDDKHPYIHAVELDKLSANIARKLYPTAQIENAPFQNSLAARNIGSYDLIIGNPPYANVKIQDKMIHDYFMLKSIENLKENGISIQIVTHNFMDKMSSAKMQIAKNAEFLGGVRLPNDTFKDAKVTTDILVFRKLRADEVGTADTSWTKLSDFENGLKVSSYFKEQKPQNVLGELITQKGQFGDSVGVKSTGFDLENLDLSKFIKESKEAFHTEKMHLASTQLAEPQKTGNFYKENGEIFQNGQKVDLKERLQEYGIDWADSTFEKRIGDFKAQFDNIQELKNTLLDLQRLELVEDFETPKMKALRAKLNAEFNKLVGKDGSLYDKRGNAKAEFSVFEILDDTSFEIFALQDAKGGAKADIFTKRINYPYKRPMSADNLNEAMQISRNEYGKYDIGRMSDLLNKSKDEVQNELLANKFIYIDSSGKNVPKDEFLSGDVKTKLERFYDENGFLKFSDDENVAKWQRQAFDDLKAVIPKDVELPLINIPLGATFLDKRILNEFLKDELGLNVNWLDYKKDFGWDLNFNGSKNPLDEFVIATSDDFATNTGIRQINAISYLNDMLNNKTLQVKRSVKQQDGSTKIYRDPIASQQLERMSRAIEQRFMDFIQNHAEFAPLALRQYNDTFNRWVARKYDGSHLEFIGKNREKLAKAQVMSKNGIDEGEIWDKTGWYLDKDGKWKFEINPQGGEIKLKTMPKDYSSFALDEVIKDNALFKAYPHLKDIAVDFGRNYGFDANFYENTITINMDNFAKIKDIKRSLYHEIQHAVQEKESFARGTNEQTAGNFNAYQKTHGEVEARNVENRMRGGYEFNPHEQKMRLLDGEFNDKLIEMEQISLSKDPNKDKEMKKARAEFNEIRRQYQELKDKKDFKIIDRKAHPHKTQDTNINDTILYFGDEKAMSVDKDKLKNFGKMSQKQQGKSMDLSEFLDENGAVDYQKLENLAVNLPSKLSYKGFLRQFKDTNKVIINTPIKDLEVNPKYMFFHLTKYGDKQSRIKGNGKENRLWLNGGVLETLQKPLFVTQDTSGTIYFYKAFKNNKGLINLVSVAVPKNNSQMIYKTSYDGTNKRILDLIKNHKLLYKAS